MHLLQPFAADLVVVRPAGAVITARSAQHADDGQRPGRVVPGVRARAGRAAWRSGPARHGGRAAHEAREACMARADQAPDDAKAHQAGHRVAQRHVQQAPALALGGERRRRRSSAPSASGRHVPARPRPGHGGLLRRGGRLPVSARDADVTFTEISLVGLGVAGGAVRRALHSGQLPGGSGHLVVLAHEPGGSGDAVFGRRPSRTRLSVPALAAARPRARFSVPRPARRRCRSGAAGCPSARCHEAAGSRPGGNATWQDAHSCWYLAAAARACALGDRQPGPARPRPGRRAGAKAVDDRTGICGSPQAVRIGFRV